MSLRKGRMGCILRGMRIHLQKYACRAMWGVPLLLYTVLCLLAGCSQGNPDGEGNAADSLQQAESDPLADVNKSLEYSPNDHRLYAERAKIYFQQGQIDSALADIRHATRLDSFKPDPEYRYLMGYFFYRAEADDSAEKYLTRAIEMETNNPEAYYQLGNLRMVQNRTRQAIVRYLQAISFADTEPSYYFGAGFAYQQLGKPDSAEWFYKKSVEVDPDYVKGLAGLYKLYKFELKDEEKAIEYNQRILAVDSLHPVGHFNTGELYFQKALGANSENQRKIYLQSALNAYQLALARDPDFARALYSRGYTYFELGQFDKALRDFQRVTTLAPDDFRAWFMLGSVREYFQDYAGALEAYQKAVELKPGFQEARVAVQEVQAKARNNG